jgi:hypothetical protein
MDCLQSKGYSTSLHERRSVITSARTAIFAPRVCGSFGLHPANRRFRAIQLFRMSPPGIISMCPAMPKHRNSG